MKNKTFILAILVVTFTTLKNQAQTVTDIDGNVYNTVKIGTQVWMVENLKVTHYRNGVSIPNITNNLKWNTIETSAYCIYDNDSKNAAIYGLLYNWYAVADKNNICPKGWHIPSDTEWNILEKYLDNTVDTNVLGGVGIDIANKLKETGTTHWKNPNNEATNSSGFSALPGGITSDVTYNGLSYNFIGGVGFWWSSSKSNEEKDDNGASGWMRSLRTNDSTITRGRHYLYAGLSIRCIKD